MTRILLTGTYNVNDGGDATQERVDGAPDRPEIEKVIEGDYYTGCGACAYVAPRSFSVEQDKRGQLVARMSPTASSADRRRASRVCPFAVGGEDGEDEDSLAGSGARPEWTGRHVRPPLHLPLILRIYATALAWKRFAAGAPSSTQALRGQSFRMRCLITIDPPPRLGTGRAGGCGTP